MVLPRANSFIGGVRNGSWAGENASQFSADPPMIAPMVIIAMGIKIFISESLTWCKGDERVGARATEIKNRME